VFVKCEKSGTLSWLNPSRDTKKTTLNPAGWLNQLKAKLPGLEQKDIKSHLTMHPGSQRSGLTGGASAYNLETNLKKTTINISGNLWTGDLHSNPVLPPPVFNSELREPTLLTLGNGMKTQLCCSYRKNKIYLLRHTAGSRSYDLSIPAAVLPVEKYECFITQIFQTGKYLPERN